MAKSKHRIALTAGKRILIVVVILIALMVGTLEFAEGYKEPLRLGLQDYISRISGGHRAEITTLEKSEIFPQLEFVLKDIIVRDKEESGKTLVTADRIHVATNFWKMSLGIADYRIFQVENAAFATGYILPKKLTLSYSGITDPSPQSAPPYFTLDGEYNNLPLLITAEMERQGKKTIHYDFAKEIPVTFKLGRTEASARFLRGLTRVDFAQMVISSGGRRALVRTEEVSFDPLLISFAGDMGGFPFSGEIKANEDYYDLYIQPESDDREFLVNLKAILSSIQKDLGIRSEDNTHIRIDMRGPNVSKQGTNDDKEKSPE